MRPTILIGCSGWQYASWRGTFYPWDLRQPEWLHWYSRRFPTVEVNSTFYRLPKRESVEAWLPHVPPGFRFGFKGSKFLTQNKKLIDFAEHAPLLMERVEPLVQSPKAGPLLWQLPERWGRNLDRLEAALEALPPGVEHCFEFRDASWFEDDAALDLLRAHGVGHAIGHHPERQYQRWELTTDWTFVRLHFSADDSTGNYSDAELERLAQWLEDLPTSVKRAWVYFNNDWEAYAIENAMALQQRLVERIPQRWRGAVEEWVPGSTRDNPALARGAGVPA